MKNPGAYRTILAELDEATASGKLSVPHIQYSEAAGLPYLDACCKEGMRLVPSLGMALPRNVPPGGRQIAGEFFPEGITVGVSAPNVHRSKEVFGENAEEFDPERWFRRDAVNMEKHMLHVSIWPMGIPCIGEGGRLTQATVSSASELGLVSGSMLVGSPLSSSAAWTRDCSYSRISDRALHHLQDRSRTDSLL